MLIPQAIVQQSGSGGSTELDYAEITANVAVSSSSEASPDNVVTLPARSFSGSTTIIVEFYAPYIKTPASGNELVINLWDANTDLGRLADMVATNGGQVLVPCYVARRLTPSAGSHTYRIRAWRVTADCEIGATAPYMPAFIRSSTVA